MRRPRRRGPATPAHASPVHRPRSNQVLSSVSALCTRVRFSAAASIWKPTMPDPPDQPVPEPLTIDLEHPSTSTIVCTVRGDIDLATETTFRAGLERTVGTAPTIVVDLGEVTFIGSIAIAIIIDVLQRLSDFQTLKVVTGRSSATVFDMIGLNETADCFPDRSTI
ncbi:STAS domain-containing protein [Pseudonocardia bannensis]|uniref:STAS domain-containing protein n=1 Tax=Pseudonocardia bannensis TaxID=630973 RepID=A0A848DLA4_9PSEU|nr:STAS domain-containing protein [Pseudonocardia bannensis]NMH93286.1 STAS domain-containing protein [Pseudonocardia bannensis]